MCVEGTIGFVLLKAHDPYLGQGVFQKLGLKFSLSFFLLSSLYFCFVLS